MADQATYHLRLTGLLAMDDLNAMSPLALNVEQTDGATTLLSVCTDQSGLVGLLRHLHGLGCVFISMNKEPDRE